MNNKSKSAGRPAPNENRIEEILSNIQPMPGEGLRQKMQRAPWQAARIQPGKSTMKTKFAFSMLALLLVLAATVAFVPPVRAQVAEWFAVTFHDPNGNGSSFGIAGDQPMKYQVLQPGYLPKGFGNQTIAKFGEITEVLYKTDDRFLILTETATVEGESLPEGEAATVNGQPAVLNKGLSGTYRELPEGVHPSDGGSIAIPDGTTYSSGADGGDIATSDGTVHSSGVVSESAATVEPITFDYTDAVRLTFITGDTKIELLSNLPVDEILKIAEGLVPAN